MLSDFVASIVPKSDCLRPLRWVAKPAETLAEAEESANPPPRGEMWKRIGFCVVAVLFAHVVQLLALRNAEHAALDAGKRQAELALAATEVWLRRTMEDVNFCLDLLQSRQILEDTKDPRSSEIEATLSDIVSKHRFDIWVALTVSVDGIALFSSEPKTILGDKSSRPHVRSLGPDQNRIYLTDPYWGLYSQRLMIAFSRHLKHADGSPAGAASVALDPLALSQHLLSMMSEKNQNIGIWRDGGEAIVLSGWGRGSLHPPTKPYPALMDPLKDRDVATYLMYSDVLQSDVITASKRLPDLGVVLTSHVTAADVLAGVNAEHTQLIWVKDAVAGLFAFALVMWQRQLEARRRIAHTLASVTDSAKRAAALQAEIDNAMDMLPGAIYRMRLYSDGRRDFQFISRSVERMLGWPAPVLLQALRETGSVRDAGPTLAESIEVYSRQLAEPLIYFEDRMHRYDGSLCWVRFTQQRVAVGDGFIDIVGLITDIEVERASVASAIASARLITLGEMASGMAHEISQPLAMMSLAAENAINALKRNGPEVAIARLQRIPEQAQRVRSIIDHLRLFARQQPNRQEAVDIPKVVEGAMVLVEGALRGASVQLNVTIQPDLPAVMAEQVMLEQVLVNLLLNARDAMAATPAAARRIDVSARLVDGVVELVVEDAGSGIPAHLLPRLFEPFFTTKPPGQGTGLGLSICHGIIRSFGGTIHAVNRSQGARFTVTLNLAV